MDFEDLELGVRDLLAREDERRRWSERFALIMVDEFQDTNRLQLDLLEALERDNLFAVGDEFQSIYRFRHADVQIFRERRALLGEARVRGLAANFRSDAELLDVLNAAFAPELGAGFRPLVAGRERAAAPGARAAPVRSRPASRGAARRAARHRHDAAGRSGRPQIGLAALADQPWRRAEARLVAHRLREEIERGPPPGRHRRARPRHRLAAAVRAGARGPGPADVRGRRPRLLVPGAGPRRPSPTSRALANPRDEAAFYAVLASPFCGAGSDALALLAAGRPREPPRAVGRAARRGRRAPSAPTWLAGPRRRPNASGCSRSRGFFGAERGGPSGSPVETLLERAIVQTGYDLAILARAGGERRLANLRKLMRLARDYEHAEGRDLRGFLAFAVTQDLAEAREGEAALESEGLDAVRLMTIHRAKGLEFPVVCVADLGRLGAGGRPRLLLGATDGVPPATVSGRPAARRARRRRRGARRSPTTGSPPRRTAPTPRRSAACSTSR